MESLNGIVFQATNPITKKAEYLTGKFASQYAKMPKVRTEGNN